MKNYYVLLIATKGTQATYGPQGQPCSSLDNPNDPESVVAYLQQCANPNDPGQPVVGKVTFAINMQTIDLTPVLSSYTAVNPIGYVQAVERWQNTGTAEVKAQPSA